MLALVGRGDEMTFLEAALARSLDGHGQVVAVVGRSGVGKSRLCHELLQRCRDRGVAVHEAHGDPHDQATPFLPALELFRSFFAITERDTSQGARDKITGGLLLLDETLRDRLPLLCDFLGVPDPRPHAAQLDPEPRQRQILSIIERIVHARSRREPAVVLLEDLDWFDGGSESVLEVLVEAVIGTRTLLLLNFRSEYQARWMQRATYLQLPLLPLPSQATAELLRHLLGPDPSLGELGERIRERTEGNPLFAEEIVHALAAGESLIGTKGAYRLSRPVAALPATLPAAIAARIDRIPERERQMLQIAAVIGRRFTPSLLRRVGEVAEAEAVSALAWLAGAELLYEGTRHAEPEYVFQHALTRETAYDSIPIERRQALHERTAMAIENLSDGARPERVSELAHHYTRSRNTQKGIEYSRLAGEQAVERCANLEAVGHFTRALDLLGTLPDGAERARKELALQIALGAPLMAAKGCWAPEVEKAYARARELSEVAEKGPQLFTALRGLWTLHEQRADLGTARELAERCLTVAERTQNPRLILCAHAGLGETLVFRGEFVPSRVHLELAIALYNSKKALTGPFLSEQHPAATSLNYLPLDLWYLGYPSEALRKMNGALALARELDRPFSLAEAVHSSAWLHWHRREWQASLDRAEANVAVSTKHGLPLWLAWATVVRGAAFVQLGQVADGIEQIRHGLDGLRAMGAEVVRQVVLVMLAEAYWKAGQADQGLAVLTDGLAAAERSEERLYEAESYRLKGELLLALSPRDHSAAEGCFNQAIDIARRQNAKSWELRAVTSLSHLLRRQGKQEEARRQLGDVYGWFTEGFDTPDLTDAKALLDELS